MKLKKIIAVMTIATMIMSTPAFSAPSNTSNGTGDIPTSEAIYATLGHWEHNEMIGMWWWQNDDGTYPYNSWNWIDGNGDGIFECYYFDSYGYMAANTKYEATGYYVNPSGAWEVDGVVQTRTTGTGVSSGSSVYAGAGHWASDSIGWWWQNNDGTYPCNTWNWLDGNQDGVSECYYFGPNGYMYANTTTPDNYTVNSSGAWISNGSVQTRGSYRNTQTGWVHDANGWRYYLNTGSCAYGWRTISGERYYFDDTGYALTGYQDIDGEYYYFFTDCSLAKRTVYDSSEGLYYYIDTSDYQVIDVTEEYSSGMGTFLRTPSGETYRVRNTGSSSGNSSSDINSDGSSSSGSNDSSIYDVDVDIDAYTREVFKLVNEERASRGRSSLEWSDELADLAQIRAEELVESFSHTRPDGSVCFTVIEEAGMSFSMAAENIAMGTDWAFGPDEVMDSWMNSSGHRANILHSSLEEIGVGCYHSGGNLYWVQLFTAG